MPEVLAKLLGQHYTTTTNPATPPTKSTDGDEHCSQWQQSKTGPLDGRPGHLALQSFQTAFGGQHVSHR